MSFNTTTYDGTNVAYNIESPIYIDGTTPTIPIKGSTYYPGITGNVMCAFAVDGGDSLLGGNAVVFGVLSVGGNLRVDGNTISSATAGYLGTLSSNVQTQINTISLTPGPIGATGATGAVGATGATGVAGAAGDVGATGATGVAGAAGAAGTDGGSVVGPRGSQGWPDPLEPPAQPGRPD